MCLYSNYLIILLFYLRPTEYNPSITVTINYPLYYKFNQKWLHKSNCVLNNLLQFLSSDMSPQSLSPSHSQSWFIHLWFILHKNSLDEHSIDSTRTAQINNIDRVLTMSFIIQTTQANRLLIVINILKLFIN